ncbi:MAG: cell division protein SepF [Clostridia bacterium]|nr:cell division protein SepF [Clostridia bacterium]
MAKLSGFADLLQRLKIIQIEEEEPAQQQAAPARMRSGEPSVYENAYDNARGFTRSNVSSRSAQGKGRTSASAARGGRNAMQTVSSAPAARPDTVVYYVSSLSECAVVIKDIIAGVSAVINFDGTDDRTSQRIIDTLAGAAFALNAKVRKITDNTYIIAPKNVNVNMSRHIERRY